MNTKLFSANGSSRRLPRCAALSATIVASALLLAPLVFAQANVGSDPGDPLPWGSVNVANPPDPLGNFPGQSSYASAGSPQMQPLQLHSLQADAPQALDRYNSNAANPPPWGSSVAANPNLVANPGVIANPSNNYGDVPNRNNYYGEVSPYPLYGNDTTPLYSSPTEPAPEQLSPESSPEYAPLPPGGLVESFGRPPINPNFAEIPPAPVSLPVPFGGRVP